MTEFLRASRTFLNEAKRAMIDCSFGEDLCLSAIDGNFFGILVEIILVFYCLVGVGNVVDEKLVPALESLCDRWRMKEDVAGATFLAIGSAAPEIVISVITAIEGGESLQLGVSSIFGSGLMGFLVVPGLCAMIAPESLLIKRGALIRDCVVYYIELALLFAFISDGVVTIFECVMLILVYVVYILWIIYFPKLKRTVFKPCFKHEDEDEGGLHVNDEPDADNLLTTPRTPTTPVETKMGKKVDKVAVFFENFTDRVTAAKISYLVDTIKNVIVKCFTVPVGFLTTYLVPNPTKKNGEFSYIALLTILISFLWIAFYSFVLATIIERWCQIIEEANPDLVGLSALFGITVISWGSAVPDTIQSMAVSRKGLGSMALSNSIGSQIVNVCTCLRVFYSLDWCRSWFALAPFCYHQ